MGASNPHPHGQVWASSSVPSVPQREWDSQLGWMLTSNEPLLSSYLAHELAGEDRIVASAGSWTALVPFWAVWPFEVMVLPSQPCTRMADLEESARTRWDDTVRLRTAWRIPSGCSTVVSIHPSCVRRRFVSFWLVTRCLVSRSET